MEYLITKDDIKIYYEIKGEGTPVIFVHGFSEDHSSFRIQQRALSKKFKTITFDLRGHGKSDRPCKEISIDKFADDLKYLIGYLELDNIILVGWSMGASIVFEYIKRFGQEKILKLCIVDKSPKVINDDNWNLGLYHGRYRKNDGLRDLSLIEDNWIGFAEKFVKIVSPNFNDKQLNIAMERIKRNSPKIMYLVWKSMMEKDYRDILKDITIPTLIVFGQKSTLYSVEAGEYLEKNIKNSQLVVFEDCTHLLVLENPIKFNKLLEEFIG